MGVGCEDVPGFEAVALGLEVDVPKVLPGIVKLAKEVIAKNPKIRAILFECTELPPYSQAVREATGLPVIDSINMCNFVMSSRFEPDRFARNILTNDGPGKSYFFGDNLTTTERARCIDYEK